MHVAAIVLAAGSSTRLGRPKQLVEAGGTPLLQRVVAGVHRWPVESVVVVLGAGADDILDAVDFGEAIVAINEGWEEGIASSLRVGLDILSREPKLTHAFVALGDQPGIPEDVPAGLVVVAETATRPAIVPVYRYERSNPVLFARSLWERLMALEGDAGAAGFLLAHPQLVHEVRFDHLPPRDVDTEHDVADLGRPRTAHGDRPG
jgi:molybdenum cofactor cytidylyltransferase